MQVPWMGMGSPEDAGLESASVSSRCAVRVVHESLSNLVPEKVRLVQSIGFGGLLTVPGINMMNNRFSLWLLRKVDATRQAIVVDSHRILKFSASDVNLVLGIPCGGKAVVSRRHPRGVRSNLAVKQQLRVPPGEPATIKLVQEIVERDYKPNMTKADEDCFKVAFVMFVMSTFLAPGARHDCCNTDYWHAISNPSDIRNFDWASYVMHRLLDTAKRMQEDFDWGRKGSIITCCPLFLQVLYLDSVNLGQLNMKHDVFPRISQFPSDRLRSMIAADSMAGPSSSRHTAFGASKLRPREDVCYSWASEQECISVQQPDLCAADGPQRTLNRIKELPCGVISALAISLASTVIRLDSGLSSFIHSFIVAALDQVANTSLTSGGATVCSSDHNKPIGALIVRNQPVGQLTSVPSKRPRLDLQNSADPQIEQTDEGLAVPSTALKCGCYLRGANELTAHREPTRPNGEDICPVVGRLISSMQQLVLSRQSAPQRFFDLNEAVDPGAIFATSNRPYDGFSVAPVPTPWQLGYGASWDKQLNTNMVAILETIHDSLGSVTPETSWFVHCNPYTVSVDGESARLQLLGQEEFSMDMVDIFIRRLRQIDDEYYCSLSPRRWRHVVESEYLAVSIAGWSDRFRSHVRDHLHGPHLCYSFSTCKMLFFPLYLEKRWVCYAWNLPQNEIAIFDPLGCTGGRPCTHGCSGCMPLEQSIHGHVIEHLKTSFAAVCHECYPSISFDFFAAKHRKIAHRIVGSDRGCVGRTGMMVTYFCRAFDGDDFVHPNTDMGIDHIRALLLMEIVELKDNLGSLPHKFTSASQITT